MSAPDFSSFLLQAQASKAKVVGFANAGLDTSNAIKQAAEFGVVQGGQRLAALLFTLAEVHGLGLQAAQGLVLTEGYYWDLDDQTRAFGKRFQERTGRMPNMVQAGTYSAVTQYLKAIQAAGTDETEAVAKKLHEMPVEDFFARRARCSRTGAWCTTCTCSRSRSRPNRRGRGTTTSTFRRSQATKPSRPCRTAAAR